MYSILLSLHSFIRWALLLVLLTSIFRGFYGWKKDRLFTKFDNSIRHWTATIAHVQLLLGFCLYAISPLVDYFLMHFSEAIHLREIRFFGMEHSTVMLTSVVILTIGSMKAKRRVNDRNKFKTMTIWYSIALLLILSSIPWSFSPLTSRPNFRF